VYFDIGARGGEPVRHFNATLGYNHLKESVYEFEKAGVPQYSCLCPKLTGIDPDDVFSSVPYGILILK
jgi:leukotriene-A4 hydrolase